MKWLSALTLICMEASIIFNEKIEMSFERNTQNDNMLSTSDVLKMINVSSKLQCSIICTADDQCMRFGYNTGLKTCSLHWIKDISAAASPLNGWINYPINEITFPFTFDPSYQATYGQAEDYCLGLSTHVAALTTQRHLISAFSLVQKNSHGTSRDVYIGLFFNTISYDHIWSDGTTGVALPWDTNQPEQPNDKRCVAIDKTSLLLRTTYCNQELRVICY